MGEFMQCRVRAPFALALVAAVPLAAAAYPAFAGDLPAIKASETNSVPACATPGRLHAFLESRNSKLDSKFSTIAADYMRLGEELNVRWDTAFFQMMLETGNLTFTGDVSVSQNNFAGLGATGKKAPGETFPDVATGVKAHLQHLLLYAGDKLDNPVAERTRKVQEWEVLAPWQKTLTGPVTFTQLAKQWAPTSRGYARDIASVSDAFYDGLCKAADPKPELIALARPGSNLAVGAKGADAEFETASVEPQQKLSGADLARRAVDEARASGSFVRSNLGAGSLLASTSANSQPATVTIPSQPQPSVTILNAAKAEPDVQQTVGVEPAQSSDKLALDKPGAKVQLAALGTGGSLKSAAGSDTAKTPKAEQAAKCHVWTASYGGTRAVIIRARADQSDNYTVLDVNEGAETREADAYIAAYAKGGQTVGEYPTSTQALDKAFELCPEG